MYSISSADPVLRHLHIYIYRGKGGIFNNFGQHFTHNSGLAHWLSVWSKLHDFYKLVRGNDEIYFDIWGNTLFTIMVLLIGAVFQEFTPLLQAGEKKWRNIV